MGVFRSFCLASLNAMMHMVKFVYFSHVFFDFLSLHPFLWTILTISDYFFYFILSPLLAYKLTSLFYFCIFPNFPSRTLKALLMVILPSFLLKKIFLNVLFIFDKREIEHERGEGQRQRGHRI